MSTDHCYQIMKTLELRGKVDPADVQKFFAEQLRLFRVTFKTRIAHTGGGNGDDTDDRAECLNHIQQSRKGSSAASKDIGLALNMDNSAVRIAAAYRICLRSSDAQYVPLWCSSR